MTSSVNYKLIDLPDIIDVRGNLTVAEFGHLIPFDVKRFFMVYQVPLTQIRGEHAHYNCHQFLLAARGRISVIADDGIVRQEFLLDKPNVGLYLPPLVWGVQYKYSPDACLLVLHQIITMMLITYAIMTSLFHWLVRASFILKVLNFS